MTHPHSVPGPSKLQGLDFVALDVETANATRGSICAVGVTIVRGGRVTETVSWLTQPPEKLNWFDPFNVMLHGITPEDVESAPNFAETVQALLAIIGDLPVVAHNAAFDIGALRDGCDADGLPWPTLTYGCSLVMSRQALDLISYRLPLVAAELGVPLDHHHDAGSDSLAAASIVRPLAERTNSATLLGLTTNLGVLLGQLKPGQWFGCRGEYASGQAALPTANPDADPANPLFGQVIVFTGGLGIVRAQAWDLVAAAGATPEKGVNKRTTLLVIGDGFIGDDPSDFATGKAARATLKRAKGQRLEVLTEEDLCKLLIEPRTSGYRLAEHVV